MNGAMRESEKEAVGKSPGTQGAAPESGPSAEWLQALKSLIDRMDPQDLAQAYQDTQAFMEGKMTWAQVQGIPRPVLLQTAEKAYQLFQSGKLEEAEAVFRSLTMMDDVTGYYHTALGAIYQKQKRYFDSLVEYTAALELDPDDLTAYVNRGEVYFLMGNDDFPLEDFDEAIRRDPDQKDPWANRARFLKKQLLEIRGEA